MNKFPKLKWWMWLLPILFLLLKAYMVTSMISGGIGTNVADATGISPDQISVDGRNVTIDGPESDAVRETVKATPWVADVNFTGGESLDPSTVTMMADGGEVVLSGVVASEAERTALFDSAKAEFEPDLTVVDQLTVDADAVTEGSGKIVVEGAAGDDAQKATWIAAGQAVATSNGFEFEDDVTVPEAETPAEEPVDEPETLDALNALFELAPIEFDTNLSTIRPESQVTLDEAAGLINENPDAGDFIVVGHTDSDGGEASNQALSQARAEAVVDYLVNTGGVDANRLDSLGKGETELKVSPEETDADRQANRRIEWEQV